MKSREITFAASGLVLLVLIAFFSYAKNQCQTPVPEPSAWGGYYGEPFVLELSAPENGTIYYTLDGSEPTENSQVYQGGILLEDRSQEPNIYNAIPNVVTDWKDRTMDSAPVPKGTVVRAIFINDLGMESEILTQTYFIGLEPPESGYTLSLVFAYEDLFGEQGIYVTGKDYDDWYLSGGQGDTAPVPNYEQDWEVCVTAELLDGSGDVLNQRAGLKIQGASARGAAKKRFTLTAREEYSGSQIFDAVLFEGVTTHSVMIKEALPDAMLPELVADRQVSVQRSVPVRVYLNGEYWYDSFMLERYDNEYFRQYYQVSDRTLIKDGVMDEESRAAMELDEYSEFLYWVTTTDFSDPEQWEQIQQEADIQSYIDYLSINLCMGNYDFDDNHNYVLWRSLYSGNTPYLDQRWRWCLYDVDVVLWGGGNPEFQDYADLNIFSDPAVFGIDNTTLFSALRPNPEFCRQFVTSCMDIVNNNFAPERVEQVLEKYGQDLEWLDGFFRRRPAFTAEHLAEEFDLTGDLETVEITTRDPELGSVVVNTSEIDLSDGSWSGKYYEDYPITVTAYPAEGCRFVGWKGDVEDGAESLTIPVDGGVSLEAVFQRE